ncbi:MAG TPA: GNAT family N-acetyltransferase [Gaiellales bacterium]|nr:GNAT family N-acetyltransferase [Gaiellales bacterium]
MTAASVQVAIAALGPGDWDDVARIYAEGIETRLATFETEVPSWQAWDRAHLPEHRLIAREHGRGAGWAALAPVSSRCIYAGVAEVSVYVAAKARGQGVGTALLSALVASSEAGGVWTLEAGILPENEASVRMHERCGFRVVGRRERLGRMDGEWRDVLLLERRSRVAG